MELNEGIERIARERQRQVDEEGFTSDHDDDCHRGGDLALAAICYAAPEPVFIKRTHLSRPGILFCDPWPWAEQCDKRKAANNGLPVGVRIRDLEKAGALIAAEIDRLLRIQEADD